MRTYSRYFVLLLALAGMLVQSCVSSAPPAPVDPPLAMHHLIDPRTGFTGTTTASIAKRFDRAWQLARAGQFAEADQQLAEIERRDPDYKPATLARAAVALGRQDSVAAIELIDRAREGTPNYFAAEVYRAEAAYAKGDIRFAFDLYSKLAAQPGTPSDVRPRLEELRRQLFDALIKRTEGASDEESLAFLREALTINPQSESARLQLVRKLIAIKRYDDARRELDPLFLRGLSDSADVQELLAEVEVGRGQFQAAITRLERLSRRTPDQRYTQRLSEVKELFNQTLLPLYYRNAIEATAITREDLATLAFWNVSSIRFASTGEPPIAVDIANVQARDEMVRALALRLYQVDPITRSVEPRRFVTTNGFFRFLGRLFMIRTPACGRNIPDEPTEALRGQRIAEACGIKLGELQTAAPDALVTGQTALSVFKQIDAKLSE